jgi:hypothetical protein
MLLFGHIGVTLGIAWFAESKLGIRMDYRLILIGSLLPDIIDKPGMLLSLNNGRFFGHTLLFLAILLLISLKYRKVLFLFFASLLHLAEDEMWNEVETLFWPITSIPAQEYESLHEYIEKILSEYVPSFSHTFISEVVGLIIILAFLLKRPDKM